MCSNEILESLAIELYEIGALKFGEFVTKVGLKTPVYMDLRVIISHPKILRKLSDAVWSLSKDSSENATQICGVPYTALPIATLISATNNIPMLIKRKEAKDYGTKKLIEGQFKQGETCVIIEDVVTSGSSILETAKDLKAAGLVVNEAYIIVDRQQGGKDNLTNNGITMKSLYTLTKLMDYLLKADKISPEQMQTVTDYLKNCQAPQTIPVTNKSKDRLKLSFGKRAMLCKNQVSAKLLELMERKNTTLCLAADFSDADEIVELVNVAGPHIAVLKIHVDIIENFSKTFIAKLQNLSEKHQFMIMEDRKFGDIGHAVSLQYERGVYNIVEWADLITAHGIAGPGMLKGLEKATANVLKERAAFLVAEMSSSGTLTKGNYIEETVKMGTDHQNFVCGFVCQSNCFDDPGLIQLTPGVKLQASGDDLGQVYNTPETVVKAGGDLIVVGRGITEASDKLAAILQYKQELWNAYEKRIQ